MRSLIFSANIAAESENEEIGKFSILTMLTTASIFAIVVFLLIPLYIGDLIGIYLYSYESMSNPWANSQPLVIPSNITVIQGSHWALPIYFQNPSNACRL